MSLEERIVDELTAERRRVPTATPGPMPSDRHHLPSRLIQVAAVLAALGAALWFMNSPDADHLAATAVAARELLIDGDVVLPVEGESGTIDTRAGTLYVLMGSPSPRPEFDLALDGMEQPLVAGIPSWDPAVSVGDVPVVYIGDVNGRSVLFHTNGTISVLDRLTASLTGDSIGVHICLTSGSYDSAIGGVGFCGGGTSSAGLFVRNGPGPLDTGWATWIDVPAGTSIVTASVDGEGGLWQRPIAETVFFDLGELSAGQVTLTAISADGEVLGTETFPPERFHRES